MSQAGRDAELEARRAALEAELGEPVTLDGLTATYRIFQRKKGHRHSTDNLLTAWYALQTTPHVGRCLDLGAGIGTVGLLVLSNLPPSAQLVCVEAQASSFRLLRENLRANAVEARVNAILGDLRDVDAGAGFPLITGSPPYFPVSAGIVPADPQKAHARFELRGDVGDYARAARRAIDPAGRFVFCFPWAQKQRALDAATSSGFDVLSHCDVIPRQGLVPLFSLFACAPRAGPGAVAPAEPAFVVRSADGEHTEAMRAVRRSFGWNVEFAPNPRGS